jgi:hypothetical protein
MLGLKLVTDPRWVNIVESKERQTMPGANKSCIKCNKSHYNCQLEELVTGY